MEEHGANAHPRHAPAARLQEAEALLRSHGFSEGLFLVRDKGDGGLTYVITIVHKGRCVDCGQGDVVRRRRRTEESAQRRRQQRPHVNAVSFAFPPPLAASCT